MSWGWIGVDLDGTLAMWERGGDVNTIGAPIRPMVQRVKDWLAAGKEVRIMTARVGASGYRNDHNGKVDDAEFAKRQSEMIQNWCIEHIGAALQVTCTKDFQMVELWDDRAIRVMPNKGIPCCGGAYVIEG